MSQIFPSSMNLIAKLSVVAILLLLIGLALFGYLLIRSPLMTGVGVPVAQPVPYSHALHVGELGLDCRYCHTAVETNASASLPSTENCMGCHRQVASDSPALALVRASFEQNQPILWNRVHDLADFVYFDHGIHVQQGVGCETCHGRVDQMAVVAKAETLQMSWCLDCHREPDRFVRPRSEVFTMGWTPPVDQAILGPQLVAEHGIRTTGLTDCSVCHR
jgi:hypothetical protein